MRVNGRRSQGQALVEFVLIAPLLIATLAGIVTLGIGVFYQQQVTNAAREAARFAAISSETSQCPVVSNLEPRENMLPPDAPPDFDCDPPHLRWPKMTGHARAHVFGMNRSGLHIAACWSGFWDEDPAVNSNAYDAAPSKPDGTANDFIYCEIGGIDPRTAAGSISCPAPLTSATDDRASSLAHSAVPTANQVTAYACYVWTPPFLGEVLGTSITLRGVSTEAMQHQQ
jgi:hypothetical protein